MALRLEIPARPADPWQQVTADDETLPAEGRILLPLTRWLQEGAALARARGADAVGVWLASDQWPEDFGEALAEMLATLPVIALEFPKFADGRAYSVARLLRDRHGYTGDLRALGDGVLDQVALMVRCGFTSVDSRRDLAPEAVEKALARYRHVYQHASDGRRAVWTSRQTPGASTGKEGKVA